MNMTGSCGGDPILADALAGRIVRDVVTLKLKAEEYPGGIQAGVGAVAGQSQLPPEEAAARVQAAAAEARDRADDGDIGGLFFVGFIVFFFFILPMLSGLGRRGKIGRAHV